MIPLQEEIHKVVNQIVEMYQPIQVILFGSCAKGCITKQSDIDLCIICNYEDKHKFLTELLMNIESERDLDFVLYRPKDWEKYREDPATFAHIIQRKGVVLYG